MSARKRKRYLTKGYNAPVAWCVLENLYLQAHMALCLEMENDNG